MRKALAAGGASALCILAGALAGSAPVWAQAPQAMAPQTAQALAAVPRDQLAEVAFKNVQVLRGIPVDEFLATMGFIAASTGLNCTHCHGGNDYTVEAYAADTIELKQTARKMMVVMNTINQSFFGGRQVVTCWTCHQGEQIPHNVPNLLVQYSQILPYEAEDANQQAPGQPRAEEVFEKYLQAVGGEAKANTITSIVAKGTNRGYGPENSPRPLELYARAQGAGQLATITKTDDGNSYTTFDGTNAWQAVPHKPAPEPVLPLHGDDLAGVRLDAQLMFPGKIKQVLTDLRVGFPFTLAVPVNYTVKAGETLASIAARNKTTAANLRSLNQLSSNTVTPGQQLIVRREEKDLTVVQGRTGPGRPLVKLMFDPDTGLLVRQVRYTASPVGRVPTQIDYLQWGTVNGVKIPFTWEVTWTDGRETYRLDPKQVQVNVAIPDARFAKPPAPEPAAPTAAN